MYVLLFVLEKRAEVIIVIQVFALLAHKTILNDFSHRFFPSQYRVGIFRCSITELKLAEIQVFCLIDEIKLNRTTLSDLSSGQYVTQNLFDAILL